MTLRVCACCGTPIASELLERRTRNAIVGGAAGVVQYTVYNFHRACLHALETRSDGQEGACPVQDAETDGAP